jgi:hypothetical protein
LPPSVLAVPVPPEEPHPFDSARVSADSLQPTSSARKAGTTASSRCAHRAVASGPPRPRARHWPAWLLFADRSRAVRRGARVEIAASGSTAGLSLSPRETLIGAPSQWRGSSTPRAQASACALPRKEEPVLARFRLTPTAALDETQKAGASVDGLPLLCEVGCYPNLPLRGRRFARSEEPRSERDFG